MSDTKKTFSEQTSYFTNLQNGVSESMRDLVGIQVRSAQALMDKSVTLGQTYTDFVQSQMQEGLKLSQEVMKYGWTLAETVKKSAYELAERSLRNPNA